MRKLRLVAAGLAVAATLPGCDGGNNPTPPERKPVLVWTVNLEHLLPEHDWTRLIDRIEETSRAPDLLFLQEVTPEEGRVVLSEFERRTDVRYEAAAAPIGDNMLAWRIDRFELRSPNAVFRWEPFGTENCDAPSRTDPSQVVAARLHRDDGHPLVAVNVHWGRTWAARCMMRNLTALHELLWERWGGIDILAGDFNAHPDKQPGPRPGIESLASGRETDPDCWYRSFSIFHEDTLETPRPGSSRDCAQLSSYDPDADYYIDTVATANDGDAICDQWTSVHGGATPEGTSCTDNNDDGLRDRGRIDYIWTPVVVQALEGQGSDPGGVLAASADMVCITDDCADTRYSDHRAVWAKIEL